MTVRTETPGAEHCQDRTTCKATDGLAVATFADDEIPPPDSNLFTGIRRLGPEHLCADFPGVLAELGRGAVYLDPLLGAIVARQDVLRGLQIKEVWSFQVYDNIPLFPIKTHQVSTRGREKFWYIKRLDGWPKGTGLGQKIAIIDSGIWADHSRHLRHPRDPDFASLHLPGGMPQDYDGHGTQCAGILGARTTGEGRIGIAPECTLVVGQTAEGKQGGAIATVDFVLLSAWSIHCRCARAISFSFGIPAQDVARYSDVSIFSRIATRLRRSNKALIFCAAGNGGDGTVQQPAASRGIVPVGGYAQNANGKIVADEFVVSINANPGDYPDMLLGPSEDIITTDTSRKNDLNNLKTNFGGSSAACAFVAGVAALYFERFPDLTVEQILCMMKCTAEPVFDPRGRGWEWKGVRFPP